MAKDAKDSKIMEQKDMISQLNMVISSQNELIMYLLRRKGKSSISTEKQQNARNALLRLLWLETSSL